METCKDAVSVQTAVTFRMLRDGKKYRSADSHEIRGKTRMPQQGLLD
jgi:hypothetical protein